MSWRARFLLWFGPGFLGGVTFGDWLALLRENRFAIDPLYWQGAVVITVGSLGNSLVRKRENSAYGEGIADTDVEPPIFVLGNWRSGTTHLQYLFAVDDRFAFPNVYQATYPHTFLCTEAAASRLGRFLFPRKRFQDNSEDLERDPIEEMRKFYEALRLPDFRMVEPSMHSYVATLSGYKKNTYLPLAPEAKERIAREWRRFFEEWGYPS